MHYNSQYFQILNSHRVSSITFNKLCIIFFIWRKLLIAFNVYRQVKSDIPEWWKIEKISILTIYKKNNNYLCYVSVTSKYEGESLKNYVTTNTWGKILESNLDVIEYIDYKNKDKIRQYNRDIRLKKIGI